MVTANILGTVNSLVTANKPTLAAVMKTQLYTLSSGSLFYIYYLQADNTGTDFKWASRNNMKIYF